MRRNSSYWTRSRARPLSIRCPGPSNPELTVERDLLDPLLPRAKRSVNVCPPAIPAGPDVV